jgi:uncharacterized pyridoxamine 5'-phosphate oxidase family protein
MISSVEKIYTEGTKFCFKVTTTNNEIKFVPNKQANTDYQAIQEWIKEGNTVIDNGGNS